MIRGYVDSISGNEVAGWAFDASAPDTHLAVEIWFKDELVCSGPANIIRADLMLGNFGKGDHGFKFILPALGPEASSGLVVQASLPGGDPVELPRWWPPAVRLMAPANAPLQPSGAASDAASRPLFILGAARSGTSVAAKAILRSTAYVGNDEGHLIEMISHLESTIGRFYAEKGVLLGSGKADFMVDRVGRDFFDAGVAAIFVSAAQQLFPGGSWLDKTPNAAMTALAPRLSAIWPNSRFIFLRRRGLENVASRLRKFPENSFRAHCREWSNCMRAWTEVRTSLQGRALELDQLCLARAPELAAAEIGGFLGLTPGEVAQIQQRLTDARPEKTSADVAATIDTGELDWSAERLSEFEAICGERMDAFNYSRDGNYFASEAPSNLCSRI